MKERKEVGIERYGTPLQTNNGRNALVDAYQELLDLIVYLRQYIEEQKEKCEWKHVFGFDEYADTDYIETSCGEKLNKSETRHFFKYCPYCGKKIKLIEE